MFKYSVRTINCVRTLILEACINTRWWATLRICIAWWLKISYSTKVKRIWWHIFRIQDCIPPCPLFQIQAVGCDATYSYDEETYKKKINTFQNLSLSQTLKRKITIETMLKSTKLWWCIYYYMVVNHVQWKWKNGHMRAVEIKFLYVKVCSKIQ